MVSRECGGDSERGGRGFAWLRATMTMTMAMTMLGLVLVVSLPAEADVSFKCKNKFVRLGDSKYEVLTRCGEPVYREVVSGDDQTKVEEWIYDSSTGHKRILRFHGSRLSNIQRLSR